MSYIDEYNRGYAIGSRKITKEFVLKMHTLGMPIEEIAEICQISIALATAWIADAEET